MTALCAAACVSRYTPCGNLISIAYSHCCVIVLRETAQIAPIFNTIMGPLCCAVDPNLSS